MTNAHGDDRPIISEGGKADMLRSAQRHTDEGQPRASATRAAPAATLVDADTLIDADGKVHKRPMAGMRGVKFFSDGQFVGSLPDAFDPPEPSSVATPAEPPREHPWPPYAHYRGKPPAPEPRTHSEATAMLEPDGRVRWFDEDQNTVRMSRRKDTQSPRSRPLRGARRRG